MALSKLDANSFDLTDNYALTGTVSGVISTQKLFLIKNIDASSSGTVSFVDGASSVVLDNTYKTYLFRFINMHPATNNVYFQFQCSTDSGSNYNTTVTSSWMAAFHNENDASTGLEYGTSNDQAQGTSFQYLAQTTGNENDESCAGELYLFNPSNTTFVKHFMARFDNYISNDVQMDSFISGYFNTTSAIDAIQFKMSSGNIDSGRIALYGIK